MIKIIEGNILESNETFICQQVNCQGVMGSGLAKQIREKYPIVYQRYMEISTIYADDRESLLGRVQLVLAKDRIVIGNIFGQFRYGNDGKLYTNYDALKKAFSYIDSLPRYMKFDTVGIPYLLGCGLGGGDWNIVYNLIETSFKIRDVHIYKWRN